MFGRKTLLPILLFLQSLCSVLSAGTYGLPLFYWNEETFANFGDLLSLKLMERITNTPLRTYIKKNPNQDQKLLAIGSIFYFANEGDIVWGSGVNGKRLEQSDYQFSNLDIRAVRGPLTRRFILEQFQIHCPEVYGDPGLLLPYFFPEFLRKENPSRDYIVIPHYSENHSFSKSEDSHVVYTTDPWYEVIEKILDSKLVISSSLHGVVIAEAFGIPARLLRITDNEPMFKFEDYYLGTNRPDFQMARTVEEAIELRGESPPVCDLKRLYEAFPFEFWPDSYFESSNELFP